MNTLIVILSTCPDKASAQSIARMLVDKKLAACVQVSEPVTSYYQWQEKTVEDIEYQLIIKTLDQHRDDILKAMLSNHPYDVPQFVVLDSASGSQQYMEWIKSSLQ